jgi:hypothetical protein
MVDKKDTSYFSVVGRALLNFIGDKYYENYKLIEPELLAVFWNLDFADVLKWLTPATDPKYSRLESLLVQIIRNDNIPNIPKPSTAIYLKLVDAGFTEANLVVLGLKLLETCSESEFLEYETRIYAKLLNADFTRAEQNICDNPKLSYHFITSYLTKMYMGLSAKIQWNRIAISKGALDVIFEYNLTLTPDDIANINKKYCTFENIEKYKLQQQQMGKNYPELFCNIYLDDFLRANNITDSDHTKINYSKYLDVLNINIINHCLTGYYYYNSWIYNIQKYHPDLVRQFLDYILISPDKLAQTKITLAEKLDYIKNKLITKEYTHKDIAVFVNELFDTASYYKGPSTTHKFEYSFAEIIEQLEKVKIPVPWQELMTGVKPCYVRDFIDWQIVKQFINPPTRFHINIYTNYLRKLKTVDDWTPSIQLEYLNILDKSNWLLPQEYDHLINCFPIGLIANIPPEQVYKYTFYRHDGFTKLITNPDWRSLKTGFARVIRLELESELANISSLSVLNGPDCANPNYKLKALGLVITQNYLDGLDILEYFSINGIAEVIFCVGTEYLKLSVDVLLGLITLTFNPKIITAFRGEIERKLKVQAHTDKLAKFGKLFVAYDSSANSGSASITDSISRLVNAIHQRPVKYWSEDEYQYACQAKLITPEILSEFWRIQPVPHPDFNWRILTSILGTDQIILAHPELPWRLPVYHKGSNQQLLRDVDWEYLKDRTLLYSHDCAIWNRFSGQLPLEFICQRPNYKFQWHNIIIREDFNPTPEQWQIIKPKLQDSEFYLHPKRYPIKLIMDNLDMKWDLRRLINECAIPLKYLPKIFAKHRFNKSLLDDSKQKKPDEYIAMELEKLRYKIVLKSLVNGLSGLKQQCRAVNYLFGNRPHIEKIVVSFITQYFAA